MLRRILLSLLLLFALPLAADEVWTIGGSAYAYSQSSPCNYLRWAAHAVFHNRGNAPEVIELVHVSNGGVAGGPEIGTPAVGTVPANTSRSDDMLRICGLSDDAIWVNRYEVPSSVLVEGRLEYTNDQCGTYLGLPPPPGPTSKLALPVFRHLSPAGEEQVHLGTDLATLQHINVEVSSPTIEELREKMVVTEYDTSSVAQKMAKRFSLDRGRALPVREIRVG